MHRMLEFRIGGCTSTSSARFERGPHDGQRSRAPPWASPQISFSLQQEQYPEPCRQEADRQCVAAITPRVAHEAQRSETSAADAQPCDETRALFRRRSDVQHAAMRLDDLSADIEPEPEAAARPAGRGTPVGLENLLQVVGGDRCAAVRHRTTSSRPSTAAST